MGVLDPEPLYLGVFPVTCSLGVPTRHLDVIFLAVAPPGAVEIRSDESDDLRWFPVDALPEMAPAMLQRIADARSGEQAARFVR